MSTYNFTLLIDELLLELQFSDVFCIAKKVNGDFTTVFQDASLRPDHSGQQTLLSENHFQWQDKYRVFCTSTNTHGEIVRSATNNIDIAFGEQTRFINDIFTAATIADRDYFTDAYGFQSYEDSFLANRIPKTLRAAVEWYVNGTWAPVYVDPSAHVDIINKQLTPTNEYMLFWSVKVLANCVIDESKIPSPYTFSFEKNSREKVVRFGYAVPGKPCPNEDPSFYPA